MDASESPLRIVEARTLGIDGVSHIKDGFDVETTENVNVIGVDEDGVVDLCKSKNGECR